MLVRGQVALAIKRFHGVDVGAHGRIVADFGPHRHGKGSPPPVHLAEVRPGEVRMSEVYPGGVRPSEVRSGFDRAAVDFHVVNVNLVCDSPTSRTAKRA